MSNIPEFLVAATVVGAGATATTDLWAALRHRLFGIAPPDYALVGRWFGYFPRGQFHHRSFAASPRVSREAFIGWTAHYLIGIAYAALLLAIWGLAWSRNPTVAPALIIGIGTVAAPLLVMQPGMGGGIAARLTAHPATACVRSLVMHAFFGIGLYLSAWAASLLH
jgi:hypothetical protein